MKTRGGGKGVTAKEEEEEEYKIEIVWRNIIGMIYLHWGAFVGGLS